MLENYDKCDKCGEFIIQECENYYIEEEDLRLCEDCYIQKLAENMRLA